MSEIPDGLYYSEEHEYLKPTNQEGVYQVGITDYAQGELGDVVFVELPEVGESYDHGDTFGTIEAVKAVSDLYSPARGDVVEVNAELEDDPSLVNSEPYDGGWMIKMRISDPAALNELLDPAGYRTHIGEEA
jgi:glycine cleavage system H protein